MARKEKDTRRIAGYVVESQPGTGPPEGNGPAHAQPVRWYLEDEGRWTPERKKARIFVSASAALSAIRDLRTRLGGIEFALAPAEGASMENRAPGA